jgi:hypothetical protein
MDLKSVIALLSVIFLSFLMVFYFFPFNTVNFGAMSGNYNFSIVQSGNLSYEAGGNSTQFYPNMRFSSSQISYRISDCSLQKKNDMENAFRIVEGITPLTFYPVTSNEEIFVTCQDTERIRNGLFIAGEGGPTNITIAGQFGVITHGDILLIQESNCLKPNIAIHELFHVLGFKHSNNPENVMYSVTSCDQTIGEDMIQTINQLYSIPSEPDLAFENASAVVSGRFLNIDMTVVNQGLADAGQSTINIYADGNLVKQLNLTAIKLGTGRIISIQNIFIPQLKVNEFELYINNSFSEISKDNNEIKLEIK